MANRFLSNIRINDAYTFPASDGSNGQVIVTDGSGNLTFADPSTSSSASVIYRDNFTGDGSTVAFTLQNSLSDEDQTFIYIDGVYQEKGTYSLSTNTITFTTAPDTGHSIEIISVSGINVGPTTIYQDNFTGDGTTTDFTLAQSIDNEVKTMIYFNGVYQFKGTYSLNGTALSFDTAPANGVDIEVISIASAAAADYNQKVLFYGKATQAISKGDAIMLGGQEGDHFLLSKATQIAIAANHEYFLGLASQDLAQGEFGYVTEFGKITELNTSGYTAGDILWFDAGGSTAGALTTTEPAPPLAKIQVAAVIRSHQNEGVLFIRPSWYHELGELHDVNITSVADKDILVWDNVNGYWENSKTVDTLTANTLSATTLTGTLSTAAQTNITSVGTLSSLDVSGDTVSNRIYLNTSANNIFTKPDGSNFSRLLYSGSNLNIMFTGGTSANSGAWGINNYEDTARIFNVLNNGNTYISGNVGIGHNPTTFKLDVAGGSAFRDTLRVVSSIADAANLSWTGSSTGLLNLYEAGSLTTQILASGNSYFNGGSVLIGQSSKRDQEKFAVVGNTLNYLAEIRETGTGGAENSGLLIYYPSAAPNSRSKHFLLNADNTATKSFLSSDGGAYFSGDVGIGDSTPNFVTSGRRVLELNGSSEALMSFAVNGTWQYYIHALTSGIYHATGDKDFVIQPGTANVGIGTTSPSATLDVHAPSTTAPSLTMGAAAGQIFKNEDLEFAFGLNNVSPYNGWIQTRFAGNTSRSLAINPLGGSVGIGTNSPSGTLQVGNGTSSSYQVIDSSSGGAVQFKKSGTAAAFIGEVTQGLGSGDGLLLYTYGGVDRPIRFYPGGSEKMRMTPGGSVLINTTTENGANARLAVVNGDTQEGLAIKMAGTTPYSPIAVRDQNNNYMFQVSQTGEVRINDAGIGINETLRIKGVETAFRTYGSQTGYTQGAIVISSGTDSVPSARGQGVFYFNEGNDVTWYSGGLYQSADRFDICRKSSTSSVDTSTAQSTYSLFHLNNAGSAYNATGTWGTISSDQRLKENIVDATPKLNDVMSLQVRNFNYIGQNEKYIGFIAQELEEVFPSLVTINDNREYDREGNLLGGFEDTKGVKVGMDFAILVKAIQEQQAIIEDLKARIETLENN